MLAWIVALTAVLCISQAMAQDPYVVWSSVIYNRIGERTPEELGTIPTVLTSHGAQQAWSAGQFFRNRYLTGKNGGIHGLSTNIVDSGELYVLALDEQVSAASAQAFVQGLYPPFSINNASNSSVLNPIDPTSISSGVYVEAPLGGYQYSQIHVAGALDPDYIYIGGQLRCSAYDSYVKSIANSSDYQAIAAASKSVYRAVGPFLESVLDEQEWDFRSAYYIYDWISYLARINPNIAALLQQPQYIDPATNQSYLNTLRWLADKQQLFFLANTTAYNSLARTSTLPETAGSISTLPGNFLAAKMLAHLESNIINSGQYYKLSLLFGDFEPLISLFSLMNLAHTDSAFLGLPEYASSAAFELYSWGNTSNVTFPNAGDLYVRFHFSNGTNYTGEFQKFSAFGRGPSQADMSWADFQQLMYSIALGGVGDWCMQCHASNLFCAAWNDTIALTSASGSITAAAVSHSGQLSPAAAGAVGAIVALAVAALIFGLIMLLGRVRFHRKPKAAKEMRGYKGSAKLASDRDLTLPKNGVMVEERADGVTGAHERTGSWEMKNAEAGYKTSKRPSLDDDDLRVNPFGNPVSPHESV